MIERSLHASRIPLHNEKSAQEYISLILERLNIDHRREYRLEKGNILDFWLPESAPSSRGLAIEVKMNGARPGDVIRQLKRYAAHENVMGIILVTNKAMPLPTEIEGKPTWGFSLGRAWL